MTIQISPVVFAHGELNEEEEKKIAEEIVKLRNEIGVLETNNEELKSMLEEEREIHDKRVNELKGTINTLEKQNADLTTIKDYYMELVGALMEENRLLKESLKEERIANDQYTMKLEDITETQDETIVNLDEINESLERENTRLRIQSKINKYLYFGIGVGITYLILK
jgi:polyhydroxyalkanoate synthesis regulator phasin